MAEASNKSKSGAVSAELEKTISLDDPGTAELEPDIDFELDASDLEARIAEVSEDIMSDSSEANDGSLPSERMSAAAKDLGAASIASQALPLPANDEHNSELNSLLYSISNKPRSYVFPLAILFTIAWLGACAFAGYHTIYDSLPSTFDLPSIVNNRPLLIFSVIVFVSLIVIWSCAILLKRSHDMKYSTNLMLSAAKQLLQPESIAIDSVSSVGTAVRREVAAIGEGVERAIARASELEYMIQNEVMNIERSYGDSETKLRRLVEEISSEREEIVLHADKLQEAISKTHTNLSSELETATTRIDETVRRSTDLQIKEVSDSVVNAGQVVAKLLETRTASFQKASALIEQKLDTGKDAFEQSINTKAADLDSILTNAGHSVSAILNTGTIALTEKSSELVGSIDYAQQKMLDEFVRQGETATKNLEDSLSIRAVEFGERISASGEVIQTSIGNKLAQIDTSMTTIGEKLVSSLGLRAEELDKLLVDRSTQIDETLNVRLSGLDETLVGHIDESISKMQVTAKAVLDNTKQAEEIISLRSQSVEDTLKKSTIAFANNVGNNIETIQSQANELTEKLSGTAEQINATVTSGTQKLADILVTQNDTMRSSISKGAEELDEILSARSAEIKSDFAEQNTAIGENLAGFRGDVKQQLENNNEQIKLQLADVKGQLTNNSNQIKHQMAEEKEALQSILDNTSQTFENAVTNLRSSVLESEESISTVMIGHNSNMQAQFRKEKEELQNLLLNSSNTFDNAIERLKATAAENNTSIETILSTNTADISTALNDSLTAVEKQFNAGNEILENNLEKGKSDLLGTISKAVADSSKFIDERSESLSTELSERIGEMSSKLDYKTAQFNRLLSERASELTTILDTKATPIAGNLESVSAVISERLINISDTVSENTTTLFNNVSNTKETLGKLTEDSAFSLTTMRNDLIEQAEQFASLMQQSQEAMSTSSAISENIYSKLQSASKGVLDGMHEIASRVETQGQNIQEATRLIDHTQSNFEAAVDNRQANLQELTISISNRSDDINNAMNTFSTVMNSLVEQVADTSSTLSGSVSSDISSAIDDATSRFNETVNAMRNAAVEMRQELETTREEMRRGVLELPEETSQSADAMRRVVTDQILALKDLTKIIEDSGQLLDTKPATEVPQPAQATVVTPPAPTPSVAPTPNRSVSPAPRLPQPTPPLRQSTEKTPSPRVPIRNSGLDQPIPLRVTPVESNSADKNIDEETSGWVSDLLRRASREPEQNPTPRSTSTPKTKGPSLQNLSIDIPNSIDDHIISDLWNRYQDGENNLFKRELYTITGQMLFDQISLNYGTNSEFKNGVDGYISDFENRLQQANEQGSSEQSIHNYLTSNQGKIYTMLAHAAGRYNA